MIAMTMALTLPLGQQAVSLAWQDEAGNSYSSTDKISVAYPTILNSVPQPPGCPLALLGAAAVFLVIIFKRRGG